MISRFSFCFLMIVSTSAFAAPADRGRYESSPVVITRHFATVNGQQIHYRKASPRNGKTSLTRPIICLHQSPNSGQVYVELMTVLAADRIVYAPDTPGYGESDTPVSQPTIDDYAMAIDGFAESLNIKDADVIGYHTGAAIAIEWARIRPDRVHSLLLIGIPAYTQPEGAEMMKNPWPSPGPVSSEYLVSAWEGSKSYQGKGQSDQSVERTFLAKIGAGKSGWWGPAAVFSYPLLQRLEAVEQPLAIINLEDGLWEISPRALKIRPDASYTEMPGHGFGVLEAEPARVAEIALRHFQGE